jgi:predicted nucleic acid-binding protein
LLIPTIVLAEALDVAEKGKVTFDFAAMYRLIQEEAEFEIVDFGIEIFDQAMVIQEIREIHDRIIVATARYYGASVLTRDRIIRGSGEVETIE